MKAKFCGSGAENNSFSLLDVFDGGTIRLTEFRKQAKYEWRESCDWLRSL
jgi:hypothetical protein